MQLKFFTTPAPFRRSHHGLLALSYVTELDSSKVSPPGTV